HERADEVDREDQLRRAEREGTVADEAVHREEVPERVVRVWVEYASRHAADAEDVHREERAVERDEADPEVNVTELVAHHPAEHLGVPEIDSREDAEHAGAEENVMNVSHDEIRVVDVDVHRRSAHVDARQAADDEHGDEG